MHLKFAEVIVAREIYVSTLFLFIYPTLISSTCANYMGANKHIPKKINNNNISRKVHRSNPRGKIFVANVDTEKREKLFGRKPKETISTRPKGFGENVIFSFFGFKLGEKKSDFRGSHHYGWGFSV